MKEFFKNYYQINYRYCFRFWKYIFLIRIQLPHTTEHAGMNKCRMNQRKNLISKESYIHKCTQETQEHEEK